MHERVARRIHCLISISKAGDEREEREKAPTGFQENVNLSKKCQNIRGVVDYLPWLKIHNIKPMDYGSYQVEGYQD